MPKTLTEGVLSRAVLSSIVSSVHDVLSYDEPCRRDACGYTVTKERVAGVLLVSVTKGPVLVSLEEACPDVGLALIRAEVEIRAELLVAFPADRVAFKNDGALLIREVRNG